MSENTIIYSLSRGTDPQVVGDLENLTTSNKSNIVSAVNEVNAKFPVSIENGGTGGTTKAGALSSLGVTNNQEISFEGATANDFIENVQAHFDNNNTEYVPYIYNARWTNNGYGVAAGIRTTNNLGQFLLLFHENVGLKMYIKNDYNDRQWFDASPTGELLYSNDSGTGGTVTMSQSSTLYKRIDIYYRNNNGYHYCRTVYNPHDKTTTLESSWLRKSNMTLALKTVQVKISNQYIYFDSNNKGTTEINLSNSSITTYDVGVNDTMFICYVIGYR